MSEGYLTTHVLDTARGCPAAGISIALYRISGNSHTKIAEMVTNNDGRTDSPILPKGKMSAGEYELIFVCGPYLDAHKMTGGAVKFLDTIPIRFGVDDEAAHYHVPLLLSPYGYSTYRGS
ncbi:hydroxyisourate hydrolase [Puniceibacterium sp. IMCC21224]|uniref:hydroxyisourate hydrolase n=1 Tax=Puniceibacterium sp. IMCC21224 TaxID=1618204 RepID=UPI00064DBE2E|nr:hydroxyisourate hydrolase [Puniceibacterium sp. IMCC21224]KMK66389.1 hydroxyisourate hydrolase [Puniceibacterium sp. IMCC21224]